MRTAEIAPAAPHRDGSWLWLLILFSVASFIEAMFYGQLAAFTPLFLPELGIPPAEVGIWVGRVAAIANVVGIPLIPLWGALADRFSRQPVIVRSFVAHMLSGVVMVLSGNVWLFVAGRAITSFSLGNSGLMMTTLAERAPRHRTGVALAIMNGSSPMGAFLGPLLGGALVDRYGFRALLGIVSALMLGVVIAMSVGYRDTFRPAVRQPILTMALDSVRLIWSTLRLRLLFVALFLLFAGWMLAFTYAALAITSLYTGDRPAAAVGLVMGLGGLSGMLLSPLLGALADRFGRWQVLTIGAGVSVFLWPLPMLARSLPAFTTTWVILNAVVTGVFAISFSVLAGEAPDSARGRVMSFSYLPTMLGLVVGPAIGSLLTRYGVLTIFPVAAVLTALGVGALVIARRQPAPTSAPF